MRTILRRVLISGIFFSVVSAPIVAAKAQPLTGVSIAELDETTHFEFSGSKTWNYEVQRASEDEITMKLPALTPEAEKKLSAYKDDYIKSIKVQREGLETLLKISLNKSNVEHFDYMTDDPSLLILDLYPKIATAKKSDKKKKSKKAASKKQAHADKKAARAPASEELLFVEKEDPTVSLEKRFGAFDASDADFGRFQIKEYEIKEDSILASKQNIYLKFPPLMMPLSRLDYWMENQPEYVIKPSDKKETKEAELLQHLYLRGREAVFLKTLEYFKHQYPDSEYLEILQNLAADIYLRRWRKNGDNSDYELAKDQLSDLVERYKDSPLTQRNQFLLAYALYEKGDSLAALEDLQNLARVYPQSPEVPFLKFAEAECFMNLHKYENARDIYAKLQENYKGTSFANQAKYRMGDVSMRAEDWDQANHDYQQSLTDFPKGADVYPNAHFNRGEALFWNGKYKESVEEFAAFLKNFPTHPYGAYAMTRIGELFDILGANKKRVMGAYLESYFRYPDQPGAKIARILMLTHKMKGMKEKAFERAREEIKKLQSELTLPDINEFVTLVEAQGYEDRGDYEGSLKLLSSYYQKHPNSLHRKTIQQRVRRNIASEIQRRSDSGDYLGALKYYEKYEKTWLQGSDRLDIDYSRAKSFEQAGVLDEALKIYRDVVARLKKIKGTQEDKQRRVEENLPSVDQVYLRMAKVLNDKRDYVEAYQTLMKMENPKLLDTGERIERRQLMADLWIQRGDYEDASEALDLLVKEFEGKDNLLLPALVKQAQVKSHLGKWKEALSSADRVLSLENAPIKLRAEAYNEKVKAQLQLEMTASAIETLQKQLDEFEGKVPTEYTRYHLGQLLYDQGDLTGAETVWSRLKDDDAGGVLWKIAEEKLKSAEFEKNYSRYIHRIPAMAAQGDSVEKSQ